MIRVARYRFAANLHAQDFSILSLSPSIARAIFSRVRNGSIELFDIRYRDRMEPTSTSLPRRPINFSCFPSAPLNAPR